jgi:hypothetical protein
MAGHPPAGQSTLMLLASTAMVAVFAPPTAWLYGRHQ